MHVTAISFSVPGKERSTKLCLVVRLLDGNCAQIPSVVKSTFDPPDPAASGWRPFDNERNGKELLSGLDFCFLSMYAAGPYQRVVAS